jgi:hypothetical protein
VLVLIAWQPVAAGARSQSWSGSHAAVGRAASAAQDDWPDFVGFTRFPELLAWLHNLPETFQKFVEDEERQQLGRKLGTLADAFGRVNNECIKLAILVERRRTRERDLNKAFDVLIARILDLRGAVYGLARDLSDEAGEDGGLLAAGLALVAVHRANVTEVARKQAFGGDRAEAAMRLHEAAGLSEKAQKMIIGFVPLLTKQDETRKR